MRDVTRKALRMREKAGKERSTENVTSEYELIAKLVNF